MWPGLSETPSGCCPVSQEFLVPITPCPPLLHALLSTSPRLLPSGLPRSTHTRLSLCAQTSITSLRYNNTEGTVCPVLPPQTHACPASRSHTGSWLFVNRDGLGSVGTCTYVHLLHTHTRFNSQGSMFSAKGSELHGVTRDKWPPLKPSGQCCPISQRRALRLREVKQAGHCHTAAKSVLLLKSLRWE